MGDQNLDNVQLVQSIKKIKSNTLTKQTLDSKKRVQFPPDDFLVEIREISPRLNESIDSNDSSDSSTDSSESDPESETSSSTSSTQDDSEEEANDSLQTESKREMPATGKFTKRKTSSISNQRTSQSNVSQSGKHTRLVSVVSKQRDNIGTPMTTSPVTPKPKPLLTRSKSASIITKASSASHIKQTNPSGQIRRSSIGAKTKSLLPARSTPGAIYGAKDKLTSLNPPSTLYTEETMTRLTKSIPSLTIEDGFIFPTIQTSEINLPALKLPLTNSQVKNMPERGDEVNRPARKSESLKVIGGTMDQRDFHPQQHAEQENRLTAWQMANGRAEDTLDTKPNIAQLWETTHTWPDFSKRL